MQEESGSAKQGGNKLVIVTSRVLLDHNGWWN